MKRFRSFSVVIDRFACCRYTLVCWYGQTSKSNDPLKPDLYSFSRIWQYALEASQLVFRRFATPVADVPIEQEAVVLFIHRSRILSACGAAFRMALSVVYS